MDLLTQALVNAQKQRENPYQQAGQSLASFGNNFVNNDEAYGNDDPKDRIVASLLTGLTGAVVQGFGAYQERERRNQLTQDLMGLSGAYYGGQDLNPLVNSLQSQDARDLVPMLQMEQAGARRELDADRLKKESELKSKLLFDKGIMTTGSGSNMKFSKDPELYQLLNNKVEGGDIPEALRPTLAKVLADQPLTLDDANAITGSGRLDLMREARQARQINEVGGRFDRSMGLREGQSQIGADLEYITPMVPAPSTVAKEQQRQASLNRLVNIFDAVAKDPKLDLNAVVGNDAAVADAMRQMAFGELRNMAGTGAALTGNEQTLVSAQDFATLGTDPVGALSRMAANRDQKEFARDMASLLMKLEDARLLKTYGAKRVNKNFSDYDPEILRSIAPNVNDNYKSIVDSYLNNLGSGTPSPSGSPMRGPSPKMIRVRDNVTKEIILVPETELGNYRQ